MALRNFRRGCFRSCGIFVEDLKVSGFRRSGVVVLLVAAGVAGFLTFVSWAAASHVGPGGGQSDDARLSTVVFGVSTVLCLAGLVMVMRGVGR